MHLIYILDDDSVSCASVSLTLGVDYPKPLEEPTIRSFSKILNIWFRKVVDDSMSRPINIFCCSGVEEDLDGGVEVLMDVKLFQSISIFSILIWEPEALIERNTLTVHI